MDFDKLLKGFNFKKVLIIGDAMIDAYMWGEINRKSPEAPVPVVEVKKHENRLGGAANVALNIQSLGAIPILCSVIGKDFHGKLFSKLMKKASLTTRGILISEDRKTTLKTRIIANKKHQLRVDEEDTNKINVEQKFLKLVKNIISEVDVLILQDYNKGVLTPTVIKTAINIANSNKIPTIVDPKKENFECYKNCTIFKPNLAEIKAGMNIEFNPDNVYELERVSAFNFFRN